MKTTGPIVTKKTSSIQCLEVLIPKNFITSGSHPLFRTLSLYSLHNHPVENNPAVHHSEIFHFMVFDWKRTIKHLLEERKVPYTIVQYFSPDTIYYNSLIGDLSESVRSKSLMMAG